MRKWELWQGENEHAFFAEDNGSARRRAEADGLVLTWTITARGANAAMQALYDHLGYGQYKPMLRPDGSPYPEDEDDDWRAG